MSGKRYQATGTATDRYYVSATDDGQQWLTTLTPDNPLSYPLPDYPPGLNQQLNEWRRWRDALARALASSDDAPELAKVFADMLGDALRAGNSRAAGLSNTSDAR